MWKTKESPFILYVDIEPELEIQPDLIMDCSKTEFPDNYFHTIFFDPAHEWGRKPFSCIFVLRNRDEDIRYRAQYKKKFSRWGSLPAYYGWDKYQTKPALLGHINKSQEEFYRILNKNGVLWLKWNEFKITLDKLLPLFNHWDVMLKLNTTSPHKKSAIKSYWVMFMKKEDVEG